MNEAEALELVLDAEAAGFPVHECSSGSFYGMSFVGAPETMICQRPATSVCLYQGCEGVSLLSACYFHISEVSQVLHSMGREVLLWVPLSRQQ